MVAAPTQGSKSATRRGYTLFAGQGSTELEQVPLRLSLSRGRLLRHRPVAAIFERPKHRFHVSHRRIRFTEPLIEAAFALSMMRSHDMFQSKAHGLDYAEKFSV